MKRLFLALGLMGLGVAQSQTQSLNLAAALEYSRAMNGQALLVMQNGQVLLEDNHNGYDGKPHLLASGTKSFWGVAAVAAQEDGLLNLEERVSDTITEWKSDPRKATVTIRQLLTLTSGLEGGTIGRVLSYVDAIRAPMTADPGTKFQYGPNPYQVFGELLKRKTKTSPVEYLKARVLNKIGLQVGAWRMNADGNPNLPSGAFLTAREWAKFGEFIRLNGQGIVRPASLELMFEGTKVNPGYGLTWWLNRPGGYGSSDARNAERATTPPTNLAQDLVFAAGAGKQRLFVLKSLGLTIVRFGEDSKFEDEAFFQRLLNAR
jgi:CubicO group peptidase (beta-lactamase class C family)